MESADEPIHRPLIPFHLPWWRPLVTVMPLHTPSSWRTRRRRFGRPPTNPSVTAPVGAGHGRPGFRSPFRRGGGVVVARPGLAWVAMSGVGPGSRAGRRSLSRRGWGRGGVVVVLPVVAAGPRRRRRAGRLARGGAGQAHVPVGVHVDLHVSDGRGGLGLHEVVRNVRDPRGRRARRHCRPAAPPTRVSALVEPDTEPVIREDGSANAGAGGRARTPRWRSPGRPRIPGGAGRPAAGPGGASSRDGGSAAAAGCPGLPVAVALGAVGRGASALGRARGPGRVACWPASSCRGGPGRRGSRLRAGLRRIRRRGARYHAVASPSPWGRAGGGLLFGLALRLAGRRGSRSGPAPRRPFGAVDERQAASPTVKTRGSSEANWLQSRPASGGSQVPCRASPRITSIRAEAATWVASPSHFLRGLEGGRAAVSCHRRPYLSLAHLGTSPNTTDEQPKPSPEGLIDGEGAAVRHVRRACRLLHGDGSSKSRRAAQLRLPEFRL